MKILIATGLYPPEIGGPATHSALIEKELPKRGISVAVVPFRTVGHLPKIVRHIAYFWKLLRQAPKVDIIYAQDAVSVGLPAALAAFCGHKKLLVRVPGDYAWEQGVQRFGVVESLDTFQAKRYGVRVGFLRAIQRFVVRRAGAIVVPSEYMKKIVMHWGIKGRRIHVIYSSVTLPPLAEPVSRPGGFVVVTVGRLVPWKNIDRIISVVACEPHWNLVIVGDGPERKKLEEVTGRLGLLSRVQFTGEVLHAEVLGWMKAANVVVLNSTYEGLSHVLVEALLLATPVIATRVGGNPEIIEDDMNGILIPPNNNEALHSAIKRVERNTEDINNRLTQRGVETAFQKFSVFTGVNMLIQLLNTL